MADTAETNQNRLLFRRPNVRYRDIVQGQTSRASLMIPKM